MKGHTIMAVGNHYLLTLRGVAVTSGTAIQNAFVYEQIDGIGSSVDLNNAFAVNITPLILAVLSVQYMLNSYYTINLDDPDDFSKTASGEEGVYTGEYMPIFNSWTFEYIRTTRAIQNGRKAFSVIAESGQQNGVATATLLTDLNILATNLQADIDDIATSSVFRPKLWRRPGTYASGVVSAPGLFYPVSDVVYKGLSTQNSRKLGRGI